MANRSRKQRKGIPGYSENRPNREDRRHQHRQVRHHTHQMLHMVDDPDDLSGLPEVRGSGEHEVVESRPTPAPRRFRVWKTRFWKRRDRYVSTKTELDANWPVITSEQLRQDRA